MFYGMRINWGVTAAPLRTSVLAVFVIVASAAAYPVIHDRRLEAVDMLRST